MVELLKIGLITKKQNKLSTKDISKTLDISIKEYGNVALIQKSILKVKEELKQYFDEPLVDIIVVIASLKLLEQSTFKRIQDYYEHSYISNILPNLNLNKSYITQYLVNIGNKRETIINFMKSTISDNTQLLFDGTKILNNSDMSFSQLSYSNSNGYGEQINLLYAFDSKLKKPSYYRILPGNIKDVSVFENCLKETNISNMTVIADKGFGSNANIIMLEGLKLKYIIPLRRNDIKINYDAIIQGDRKKFTGYFMYNNNPIWYYETEQKEANYKVYTFLNESLKSEEQKDYLIRVQNNIDNYTDDNFFENAHKFGTLSIITNLENSPKEIYETYKIRNEIEVSFDMLKNLLEADRCYMQNDVAIEGWAFINHIALLMLYDLYINMKSQDILKKYSVKDLLELMKIVKKININGKWITSEIPGKIKDLVEKLEVTL